MSFFKNLPCMKKDLEWQEMPDREIQSSVQTLEYKDNRISTSKYTCLTFIPKNLIEQFSKMANLYFLMIGILQMISEISTSNGYPVTYGPLSVIILVSALKDLFEDLKRYSSDKEENLRKVEVLNEGKFVVKTWAEIRVGDIVRINQDNYFPADILVLKSSGAKGSCFIETKNLDGEINLKHKAAHPDLKSLNNWNEKQIWDLKGTFSYEKPNPYLYTFTGTFKFGENKGIPLDNSNFILRGCSLRNTKYVLGLVAYTGHDTKIMLNSVKARPKKSKVEVLMNKFIITVFIVQNLTCLFSSLYYSFWYLINDDTIPYLGIDRNGVQNNSFFYNLFVRFGNWLIIFQNFVPISLLVTLEMVKFMQGVIISKDEKLKHLETNTYVAVQTSSLNEELGQIEYIFSDKTGTLTCNIMEFKCFCVNGESYGERQTLNDIEIKKKPQVTNVDFRDKQLFDDLNKGKTLHESFYCLALCHTIITEEKENKEIVYNASSPDELALINFAKYCGFEYMGTDENQFMMVKYNNQISKYKLLHVLEFNSTRKRQSVILKTAEGKIVLYTKGADSIIEKRMINSEKDPIKIKTWANLEKYASQGLRTLVLAKRDIPNAEYESWLEKYSEASRAINNREKLMGDIQEKIEKDLVLVAATAIEDKLQDEVGDTIESLKRANIKVWVLTGDKIETAINIGFSCKLLNNDMRLLTVDGISEQEVDKCLNESLQAISGHSNSSKFALVVSGDALIKITNDEKLSKKILQISEKCNSVIACRVSPKQKQEVVSLVRKEKPNVSTLAVGDGANDVNMITAAHVGIGIKGVEGQQAARASDYSIGEFKVLKKLILYYGRESYRKNTHLICYNFFKNMVLVLPAFWFGFLNGLSGQSVYDSLLFQLYNIIFASLPIIIYSLYDKEKKAKEFLSNPSYYELGLKNELFSVKVFWLWIFFGVWQSCILTFFTLYSLQSNMHSDDGLLLDFWACGMVIYGAVIVNTNLKIVIFTHTYTLMSILVLTFSILLYYFSYAIESAIFPSFDIYDTFQITMGTSYYYLLFFLLVVSTTIMDLAFDKFMKGFEEVPQEAGFAKMIESPLEKGDLEISPIKKKDDKVLKRGHTGFAFAQEDPIGLQDTYYSRANN